MRRLSTVFLLCFVALVTGLGGAIAWKVMGRRPAPLPSEPVPKAEYQIKDIHINETLEGNIRWTLDADQAEAYEKTRTTVMKRVVVKLFAKDATWTVTGDTGTLDNDKRDVVLEGNVVVTASDGLTMKTTTLGWRNHDRNLFTDQPVEISREGTTITGRGLDVRVGEERAVIEKNVRVVITDRKKSNLSMFPRSGS